MLRVSSGADQAIGAPLSPDRTDHLARDATPPPDDSVHATTRSEWRRWLAANHARSTGVWLISWKAATGRPRLSYDEAVEEALCFGWVDSRPRKLDETRSMLYFSPRRDGSGWSRVNKQRIARLEKAGLMRAAGTAKVEAAKRDGSWSRLDAVEALRIPADLEAAFRAYPDAAANFDAFPRSVKRGILEWIATAKKPETRARRIEETAKRAHMNERANQWRRRS